MAQKCLTLPEEKFATLILDKNKSSYDINDTIPYKCSDGYVFRDSSILHSKNYPVFTCTFKNNEAVWDFDKKACKPVHCGHPGFLKNANLIGSVFNFPEFVTYKCRKGYKYEGSYTTKENPITKKREKLFITFCLSTGLWQPTLDKFHCVPIVCPTLQAPLNGSIHYSDGHHYNSKATYSCNKGYILEGNKVRTCTNLENWDGSDPTCRKITCSKPVPTASQNSYDVGDIFAFKCPQTNKEFITKCKEDGEWTIKINCNNNLNNFNSSNNVQRNTNTSINTKVNNVNNTSLSNNTISTKSFAPHNTNSNTNNSKNNIASAKNIVLINHHINRSKEYVFINKFKIFIIIICSIMILIFLIRTVLI